MKINDTSISDLRFQRLSRFGDRKYSSLQLQLQSTR
jgi:hypothetical protein